MAKETRVWVRVLIAVSVVWVLIVAAIIFAEYLSHNPNDQYEFYFWKWSQDLLAPRPFHPNVLRIVAVLFGPLPIFWVTEWLIVWIKDGLKSRE